MTSEHEENPEYENRKLDVLGGIYRVVKSVDNKVEEILDEIREGLEASREDYLPDHYWDNNHQNGYY